MADKYCDLCEITCRAPAYWTCIDCVKRLCDVCKDVHSRIPICKSHATVPLTPKLNIYGQNVGEDYYQNLDGDARCEVKHVTGRQDLKIILEEADDQHKKLLGHLLHLKEETIPYLVGQLNSTRRKRDNYTKQVERIVKEITNKAESLKSDIENVRDHLLHALKEQGNEDLAKLSRYEDILNRKLSALKEHINICEKEMKSNRQSDKKIVERISKIKVDMDETVKAIRKPIRISPPKFITSEIEPTVVEGAYGYLEATEETDIHFNDLKEKNDSFSSYSCARVARFVTNGKTSCIATNRERGAWLGHPSSVDCVTIDGHVLRRILVSKCKSIGVLESQDELVLVTKNGKFVRVLRTGNLMYIDTAFFRALALCVTRQEDVLVCFTRTTASRKELESSSYVVSSKISRFSNKCAGKPIQEIVLDTSRVSKAVIKTGSRRRIPCYVKENLNGDICSIVEVQGKNANKIRRAVFVMSEEGHTRFCYQGADDQDDFDPSCLARDTYAHILVCDKDRIHLLNADGQFLRFLLMFNDHLHTIHSLVSDEEGKLWMSVTKRESPEPTIWVFKRV